MHGVGRPRQQPVPPRWWTPLGRGGIGIVSSNGGVSGSVNFGAYNAGKAFEWILGETLWAELSDAGVHVSTIFVGPTSDAGTGTNMDMSAMEHMVRWAGLGVASDRT